MVNVNYHLCALLTFRFLHDIFSLQIPVKITKFRYSGGAVVNKVTIDFTKTLGLIKPVHGVNNGPITCNFWYDASAYFKEAHIPYCRLHDTEYPFGHGEYVDIACIFKDFDADVDDPASYNFTETDDYLKAIQAVGAQVFYRLGASIEHQPIKRHIHPPKDFTKWAQICEHIIMHYNEGWANGYHMNIEYWEIWNEPDLDQVPPRTWTGTKEQFFEFYRTVSVHLKNRFPNLKIGGPALAFSAPDYMEDFLQYLSSFTPKLPLDFFSWHQYATSIEWVLELADIVRKALDKYGYQDTESIFDEWNLIYEWFNDLNFSFQQLRSETGTSFCAGLLCALQHAPVDKAMYYDASLTFEDEYNGLFTPGHVHTHSILNDVIPLKPYYAFQAFGKLYELQTEAQLEIQGSEDLQGCAATNGKESAVLLANFHKDSAKKQEITFDWNGVDYKTVDIYLLDRDHNLTNILSTSKLIESFVMTPNSVILIVFHQ